jgi:ParB/RepB/Spo0J family partition protein
MNAPLTVNQQVIGLMEAARLERNDVLLPPGQVSMEAEIIAAGYMREAGLSKGAGRKWHGSKKVAAGAAVGRILERLKGANHNSKHNRPHTEAAENAEEDKNMGKSKAEGGRRKAEGDATDADTAMPFTLSDSNVPVAGEVFSFSVVRGQCDPRTQGPAQRAEFFTLEVAEASSERIRLRKHDGTEFTLSAEHWNMYYASAAIGRKIAMGRGGLEEKAPGDGPCANWPECGAEGNDCKGQACERRGGPRPPAAAGSLSTVNCPLSTDPSPPSRLPIPRPSDVSVDLIDVVHNVRSETSLFDGSLAVLGENMSQQGQLEEITLMRLPGGRFRLLDGERRYRAAKAEKLASLRAQVYDQELTEAQILRLQVSSFIFKKSATHRELAAAFADYSRTSGLTGAALARHLGTSEDNVRKHERYAEMPDWLQGMIDGEKLSLNKAITLMRLPDDQRENLARRAWLHGWSEQQVSEVVNATLSPPTAGLGLTEEGGTGEGETAEPACAGRPGTGNAEPGVCRVCGCTEFEPCREGCEWVDGAETICSSCHDDDGERAELAVLLRFGLDEKAVEAMAEASLLTIGDLAELSRKHGTFWHRMVKGIGEAAAGRIDDALLKFHEARLGGLPGGNPQDRSDPSDQTDTADEPADEFDQVNHRTKARAEEAPIKGTKADTAEQRRRQAQIDSDEAEDRKRRNAEPGTCLPDRQARNREEAAAPAGKPFSGRIGLAGKLSLNMRATSADLQADGVLISVAIGERVFMYKASVLAVLTRADGDELLAAVNDAGKGNGKSQAAASSRKPVAGGKKKAVASSRKPVAGGKKKKTEKKK